jgi:hypothetical protein
MKSRVIVVLLLLSALTSCSYLTARGRQEHAYRNYVRKSSIARVKRQQKFKFRAPEMAIRQDAPTMTAEAQGPQSVSSAPQSISSPQSVSSPQATSSAPAAEPTPASPN